MVKLVLTIRKGDGVSYQEVQDAVLSLGGFRNNGSFNVTDGTTSTADDLATDWTFAGNTSETGYNAPLSKDDAAETVAYTLILFPQVFSSSLPITATITGGQSFSATLNFTTANIDAGDTDAQNEWVAGRQYNLSVTLHKTGITVNGSTIQGWEEADGDNIVIN